MTAVEIVEGSLRREIQHLEFRIGWGEAEVARRIYQMYFQDLRGITSPEIERLVAEATAMLREANMLTEEGKPDAKAE